MFAINWLNMVQALMPHWWRKQRFVQWMLVLVSGVRDKHVEFLAYRSRTIYDLQINGQTIYLEKALNDRFDPIDRLIYIENLDDLTQLYLYNKSELDPPLYLYNKWNAATAYVVGQFCSYGGKKWECLVNNTNSLPTDINTNWSGTDFTPYLRNKIETLQSEDFIVWVPIALVFDEAEMRALVDRYKLAAKRYSIQTY